MSELDPLLGPTVAALITDSRRITPLKSEEVRHLSLRVADPAFQFVEGQSIGVVVPGPHPFGNPYHVRRYSIANARPRPQDEAVTWRSWYAAASISTRSAASASRASPPIFCATPSPAIPSP